MITLKDLADNFANAGPVTDRIYRCEDETPQSKYYYYLRSAASENEADLLMVSENLPDDHYASQVLSSVSARAQAST